MADLLTTTRASARAPASAKPASIGRWELLRKLGAGEWTEVFLARPLGANGDKAHGQTAGDYAVKIPLARLANDPTALRLLRREAEVGRQVSHPRLAAILAAHVDRPPYHLAMPLLPGATLASRLATGGPLPPRQALWIARQMSEALAALHEKGWRHADVKPENVIVASNGRATLIDLGFARRLDGLECRPGGEIVGTFAYSAPEIYSAALRTDGRADVYSLGVLLFESLTGQRPFAADQMTELVSKHLEQPAPHVRRLAPHLSRGLARTLRTMLAKEPLRRPTSAELVGLLADLEIEALAG